MIDAATPPLLVRDAAGLYCPAGDFYVDPQLPVRHAVVTHAHGDHARPGMARYLTARSGLELVRARVGSGAPIEGLDWGRRIELGAAQVSLHPAGHMLGSAQVRIEIDRRVWVVSGDFKRAEDASCEPFEIVPCDCFVTEATFASPAYVWPEADTVLADIARWWQKARQDGQAAILACYAHGKAQRILAGLREHAAGPAYLHTRLLQPVQCYRRAGIELLPTRSIDAQVGHFDWRGRLLLVPPGLATPRLLRRFRPYVLAAATGWNRTANPDSGHAGFVLSDHADWPALLRTISECGARAVRTVHGDGSALIEHLCAQGIDAAPLPASPADSVRAANRSADQPRDRNRVLPLAPNRL